MSSDSPFQGMGGHLALRPPLSQKRWFSRVGFGRRARLQGSPQEVPESARKPPFHYERGIGFAALNSHSICDADHRRPSIL